jgi:hypothetical protein
MGLMPRVPLAFKSILFAVLGLAFVWLPLVDKIARDEAAAGQAYTQGKQYDWMRHKAVDGATLSAEQKAALSVRPPVYQLYETAWITTLLASAGILTLVVLNHFLQRHRHKTGRTRE